MNSFDKSSRTFYSRRFSDKSSLGGTFKVKGPMSGPGGLGKNKNNSSTNLVDLFIYKVTDGSLNDVLNHCADKGVVTIGGKSISILLPKTLPGHKGNKATVLAP